MNNLSDKEYRKIYYQNNKYKWNKYDKEERKKYLKEYYIKNKQRLNIINKLYYNKNKDKLNQDNKKRYHKNKSKYKENRKQYYIKNKDKFKQYISNYYLVNANKLKERTRIWYKNNKLRARNYRRNYRKANPEKKLQSDIKYHKKFGFIFNLNDRQYKWALQHWSEVVRKRDNHTCQICGNINDLEAHHILHKFKYPELSLNVNNGITLCKKCHLGTHKFSYNLKF